MQFTCYSLNTRESERRFVFIKNGDLIQMNILNTYYLNSETYSFSIILPMYKFIKYECSYILYQLSIFLTKKFIKHNNKWSIWSISNYMNKSFTTEPINVFTFLSDPTNIEFIISNQNKIDRLNQYQITDSIIHNKTFDFWINYEIRHIHNILNLIEEYTNESQINILALPYINKLVLYKQDIIEYIWKYL